MKLAEYLSKECIDVGVKATNKEDVLKIISRLANKHPELKKIKEEEIFEGFMKREKLGSTGFGNRIAIPHYTADTINDFVVGVLTVPEGVDFKAMDGEKTTVFIFIIAPQSKRNQHLGILSNIAKYLHSSKNVDALLGCNSPVKLYETIQSHKYTEEEVQSTYEHNLFHVIVQAEDKFEDVMNVFAEIEDCSVSVIEANNASKYLYAMPLFSSFWTTEQKGFNRIIIGIVKKTHTNRTLQKINEIIDELKNKTGIMVLVQDLFYSNGLIDV